jgi:hypothetical protein
LKVSDELIAIVPALGLPAGTNKIAKQKIATFSHFINFKEASLKFYAKRFQYYLQLNGRYNTERAAMESP